MDGQSRSLFRTGWDGRIVYYSFAQNAVLIGARGEASLTGPIALPFEPCQARDWVTPHTLEFQENVLFGDYVGCGNSWLLSTDGTDPVQRDGLSPAALSPDGRKILLTDSAVLLVAEPDGTEQHPLKGLPPPHNPVW